MRRSTIFPAMACFSSSESVAPSSTLTPASLA